MKFAVSLAFATLLAGCTQTVPSAGHEYSTPTPQPSVAAFGQSHQVGDLVVTPVSLIEDSRCAANAMCVWQGRMIIATQIGRKGRTETVRLTLHDSKRVLGKTLTLETAVPGRQSGVEIAAGEYRFGFSGG